MDGYRLRQASSNKALIDSSRLAASMCKAIEIALLHNIRQARRSSAVVGVALKRVLFTGIFIAGGRSSGCSALSLIWLPALCGYRPFVQPSSSTESFPAFRAFGPLSNLSRRPVRPCAHRLMGH